METPIYPLNPLGTQEFDSLLDLSRRGGNHSKLKLAVVLTPDTLSPRGNELGKLVGRLASLHLVICSIDPIGAASLHGPAFWNAALDAFAVPAPRLRRLSLSVLEELSPGYSIRLDDDDPAPQAFAFGCLPLSSTLFACHAPLLRTCSLEGVMLPAPGPERSAFQHVTCFNYSQTVAIHVDEVACILTLMPALVSLGLYTSFIDDHTRSQFGAPRSTSIRNLVLHAQTVAPEALCALIDFSVLSYLEICPGFDAGHLVATAYPAESIQLVSLTRSGVKIVLDDGTINLHAYYASHGFPAAHGGLLARDEPRPA